MSNEIFDRTNNNLNTEVPWLVYNSLIPLATKIVENCYKEHLPYYTKINRVGDIIRILINNKL